MASQSNSSTPTKQSQSVILLIIIHTFNKSDETFEPLVNKSSEEESCTVRKVTFNPTLYKSIKAFLTSVFESEKESNIVSICFVGHGTFQRLINENEQKEHNLYYHELLKLCVEYFPIWANLGSVLLMSCISGTPRIGFAQLIACTFPKLLVLAYGESKIFETIQSSGLYEFLKLLKGKLLSCPTEKEVHHKCWKAIKLNNGGNPENALCYNYNIHNGKYNSTIELAQLYMKNSENVELFDIFTYFTCFVGLSTYIETQIESLKINISKEIISDIRKKFNLQSLIETIHNIPKGIDGDEFKQVKTECDLEKLDVQNLSYAIIKGKVSKIDTSKVISIALQKWLACTTQQDFLNIGTACLFLIYELGKNPTYSLYMNEYSEFLLSFVFAEGSIIVQTISFLICFKTQPVVSLALPYLNQSNQISIDHLQIHPPIDSNKPQYHHFKREIDLFFQLLGVNEKVHSGEGEENVHHDKEEGELEEKKTSFMERDDVD